MNYIDGLFCYDYIKHLLPYLQRDTSDYVLFWLTVTRKREVYEVELDPPPPSFLPPMAQRSRGQAGQPVALGRQRHGWDLWGRHWRRGQCVEGSQLWFSG